MPRKKPTATQHIQISANPLEVDSKTGKFRETVKKIQTPGRGTKSWFRHLHARLELLEDRPLKTKKALLEALDRQSGCFPPGVLAAAKGALR